MCKRNKIRDYSFKKLFKMMIDRDIGKKELADAAGISYSSISRLANNQMISVDSLLDICRVLNCSIEDIMDYQGITVGGDFDEDVKKKES